MQRLLLVTFAAVLMLRTTVAKAETVRPVNEQLETRLSQTKPMAHLREY